MHNRSPDPQSPIPSTHHPITIAGDIQPSGAYILRIRLHDACDVSFGRFNQGLPVSLPAGDYVYVGSAMGKRGSSTLSNRLLRHARRTGSNQPQPIYTDLQAFVSDIGWPSPPASTTRSKTLRWHVDYLLERPEAELTQIAIICCQDRIESTLACRLLSDPATAVVAPGLGASDDRGSTHLLLVDADEDWWQRLVEQIDTWAGCNFCTQAPYS